jgi:hypothetical protein
VPFDDSKFKPGDGVVKIVIWRVTLPVPPTTHGLKYRLFLPWANGVHTSEVSRKLHFRGDQQRIRGIGFGPGQFAPQSTTRQLSLTGTACCSRTAAAGPAWREWRRCGPGRRIDALAGLLG